MPLVSMSSKIKEFWNKNRTEILDSVNHTKQRNKPKEKIEEKVRKERVAIGILLLMGTVYVLLGASLLRNFMPNNLHIAASQNTFIGYELVVLGTYALLLAFLFYCEQGSWSTRRLLKWVELFLILLILPLHLCMKGIKALLKEKRQEHVVYLLPYYLLSLLFVAFFFVFLASFASALGISDVYNECITFAIVCVLIFVFFWLGKLFAYFATWITVKSVQKLEVKRTSKINWRRTLNDKHHKKERLDRFEKEWEIVKKELEYTRIYFYIVLTVLVLCIPKTEGSISELYINQFMGITTIAALAREAKGKKD